MLTPPLKTMSLVSPQYLTYRLQLLIQAHTYCSIGSTSNYRGGLKLGTVSIAEDAPLIGRREELDFLKQRLLPNVTCTTHKAVTLSGMGGIGKTRLAKEFVRQNANSYSSIFWLNAASETLLKQSYITQVTTPDPQEGNHDPQEVPQSDQETRLLSRAKMWLAEKENRDWLLVFDSYDDPESFSQAASSYDIREYFPPSSHGSYLVTTRSSSVQIGTVRALRTLNTSNESMDILQSRSGRDAQSLGLFIHPHTNGQVINRLIRSRCFKACSSTGWPTYCFGYCWRLSKTNTRHMC